MFCGCKKNPFYCVVTRINVFVWPTMNKNSMFSVSLVSSAVLSFCDESFSHINCLGKRIMNVSLVFSVANRGVARIFP